MTINKKGEAVIDFNYNNIEYNPETKNYICEKSNLHGLYDNKGNEILPVKYNTLEQDPKTGIITANEHIEDINNCYMFNSKGEEIKSIQADSISQFTGGYTLVNEMDSYYYLDEKGNVCGKGNLLDTAYIGAESFSNNGLAPVEIQDEKWVYVDQDFERISENEFSEANSFKKVDLTKYDNLMKQQEKYSEEYEENHIDQPESKEPEISDFLPISSDEQALEYTKYIITNGLAMNSFGGNYTNFEIYRDYDGEFYNVMGSAEGIQPWPFQITSEGAIFNGLECIYAPNGNPNDYQIDNSDEAIELIKEIERQSSPVTPLFDDPNISTTINVSDDIGMPGTTGFALEFVYEYPSGEIELDYYRVSKLGIAYKVDRHLDDPYIRMN